MNRYRKAAIRIAADRALFPGDSQHVDIASDAIMEEMVRLALDSLPEENYNKAENDRAGIQTLMEAGYILALKHQAEAFEVDPPVPFETPIQRAARIEAHRIALYVGEPLDLDVHRLGIIDTCIQIIGSHDPSEPDFDGDLAAQALDSILEWAGDMGVGFSMTCKVVSA